MKTATIKKVFSPIDESDANEDTLRNDNGTPVNVDHLQLIGIIKGAE